MRVRDLRKLSQNELLAHLDERRLEIEKLKEALSKKKVKNFKVLGQTRREIARTLTVLREIG